MVAMTTVCIQELTEEGLPFMILFYHPDNQETKATFKQKVQEELTHEKGTSCALKSSFPPFNNIICIILKCIWFTHSFP